MKLEKEPRPDENFELYSSGDRKPLEDLAQKSDTMSFKGCLKQKKKKVRGQSWKQEGQLGGFVEFQVRDEGNQDQGDDGRGAEKWSSSRYMLKLEP